MPRIFGSYPTYLRDRTALQTYAAEQNRRKEIEEDLATAQARLWGGWRPPKGSEKHARATRSEGIVQMVHRRRAELAEHALMIPHPPRRLKFPKLPDWSGTRLLQATGATIRGRLDTPAPPTLRGWENHLAAAARRPDRTR